MNYDGPVLDLTVLGAVYRYPLDHPTHAGLYQRMPGSIDRIFLGLSRFTEEGPWGLTRDPPSEFAG